MKTSSFLIKILFFIKFTISLKLNENFGFEKSVANILKKEAIETGNKFVILFHSLENDDNLNLLIKILNIENIPLITFSQSLPNNR